MKIVFLFLLTLCCCFKLLAQDSIVVHKDPRLDILNEKQRIINKLSARVTASGQLKGYRLQVINTRNRELAFKIKSMLNENFAEQKTYILYQSPNFKVRFGNFTEKADADNFKQPIKKLVGQEVFVIEDIIEGTTKEETP